MTWQESVPFSDEDFAKLTNDYGVSTALGPAFLRFNINISYLLSHCVCEPSFTGETVWALQTAFF